MRLRAARSPNPGPMLPSVPHPGVNQGTTLGSMVLSVSGLEGGRASNSPFQLTFLFYFIFPLTKSRLHRWYFIPGNGHRD